MLSTAGPPRLSRDGDRTVLWLAGEQDIATAPVLADAMTKAIAAGNTGGLLVDLSGVTFIDAATIGVLVGGRNRLLVESRRLALRSPRVFAARVLEVCGLSQLIERPVRGLGDVPTAAPAPS